jgi:hypothetical protein
MHDNVLTKTEMTFFGDNKSFYCLMMSASIMKYIVLRCNFLKLGLHISLLKAVFK